MFCRRRSLCVVASSLLLVATVGCGPGNTQTAARVPITIRVTAAGKPLSNVTLTLQPLRAGGQSVGDVKDGTFSAEVVPGTYTYFIDKGKTEADLKAVPEAYRLGAMDRQLEITQAGAYEAALN